MAKIALYGGSFDPLHWGHVRPVMAAREEAGLDEVIYLPTAEPPHKAQQRFAPAICRYTMVELALLGQPHLKVSDFEMRSAGPSYTVETLEHFRGARPQDEISLLIGFDSWLDLPTWRRFAELPQLAPILVMARPGSDFEALEQLPAVLRDAVGNGRVRFLAGPRVELSSRELRRRWAAGEPPTAEQVPPLVLDYLRKYGLYR